MLTHSAVWARNWLCQSLSPASADSKLAVLGPLPLAMMAISFARGFDNLADFGWDDLPLIASTGTLCISLFFTKAALTPRIDGPLASNIFFGRISEKSAQAYEGELTSLSSAEFEQDVVRQINRNACIANIKHSNVRKSIWWLAFATPIWLLTIGLGN